MAAPDGGTFSMPTTFGRPIARRIGPAMARESWYCTGL
jgi:hypothetical protein